MQIAELYKIYQQYPAIQTDTRKLKAGDLFFALKGPNFNGNLFAKQALDAGAAYAVIDEPQTDFQDDRLILTQDVLTSLQDLALYHRQQLQIPFIAITGSNGKTTTKELVFEVLKSQFITYTTLGNLNNHIGVPLTILSVKPDAQMAVIEMGANHQQEIAGYCKYTLPTYGIITNCGKAHLEGFGGEAGVRKGKGELYDFLRNNQGTAFVMKDYDYLREMSAGIEKLITYGTANADVVGQALPQEMLAVALTLNGQTEVIQTQLVGNYNLPNVLVAVTVGLHFGIDFGKIKKAIEGYVPSNSRSQLIQQATNKIVLDAYNANPTSMRAAIENLATHYSGKRLLMLGGMMELGDDSLLEHQSILDLIAQYQWEQVVLVGGDFAKLQHPYLYFPDSLAAKEWFRKQHFEHATILIKGSRSMQMERVLSV